MFSIGTIGTAGWCTLPDRTLRCNCPSPTSRSSCPRVPSSLRGRSVASPHTLRPYSNTTQVMKHVGATPDDVRQIYVFPFKSEHHESDEEDTNRVGCFTLVEDDGIS